MRWIDRGGKRVDPLFYCIGVGPNQKDLALIPSKKRAMYRRRYETLVSLRQEIRDRLSVY